MESRYETRLAVVPKLAVGNADFEFEVRRRGRHFGVLAVSRGALVWRSTHDKTEYKIGWQLLNAMALDEGERLNRRRRGNRKNK